MGPPAGRVSRVPLACVDRLTTTPGRPAKRAKANQGLWLAWEASIRSLEPSNP